MTVRFALDKLAADGMEEAVAWHTVGIVCDGGRGIATGITVVWRGHYLILTAYHVIQGNRPGDFSLIFREPGSLVHAELSEVPGRRDFALLPKQHVLVRKIQFDLNLDLGFLEVSPDLAAYHRVRFFKLDSSDAAPQVGTTVVVRGYPSDIASPTGEGDRLLLASGFWSQIADKPRPHRFDPDREFLVKYPLADAGKHARGFSGAGAWFHRSPAPAWHPNLGLGGVCTHYYGRSGLLSFIKSQFVVRFLRSMFPE